MFLTRDDIGNVYQTKNGHKVLITGMLYDKTLLARDLRTSQTVSYNQNGSHKYECGEYDIVKQVTGKLLQFKREKTA